MEYAPRNPDDAPILPDLDLELDGLPIRVPSGVLGKGEEQQASSVGRFGPLGHRLGAAILGRLLFKLVEVQDEAPRVAANGNRRDGGTRWPARTAEGDAGGRLPQ